MLKIWWLSATLYYLPQLGKYCKLRLAVSCKSGAESEGSCSFNVSLLYHYPLIFLLTKCQPTGIDISCSTCPSGRSTWKRKPLNHPRTYPARKTRSSWSPEVRRITPTCYALRPLSTLSLTDIALFTGTSGLGKEVILALARQQPSRIFFTGRNSTAAVDVIQQAKGAANQSSLDVTYLECDHNSFSSVENAMKKFLAESRRLDVLLCNAGVMGTDPSLTKDGYESQFGINQMAHALMIKILLPTLQSTSQATSDVRIVFESSVGFRWTPGGGIRFDELKTTQDYWFAGRWVRYGQSKLANVVYASELARRYPEIMSVSVHPGVIYTNLWNVRWSLLNRVFTYIATLGQAITPEQGAHTPCWAMTTSKAKLSNGTFYENVGVVGKPSKVSSSKDLGDKLWSWTQIELESYGKWVEKDEMISSKCDGWP